MINFELTKEMAKAAFDRGEEIEIVFNPSFCSEEMRRKLVGWNDRDEPVVICQHGEYPIDGPFKYERGRKC